MYNRNRRRRIMCNYCYLKRLKKRAREDGNKVVFEEIEGGYEAKIRPRGWKASDVEEEEEENRFSIHLIFPSIPDTCTCPLEDMDNPLPVDMTTRCQMRNT
jgi:hypothetical protein